MLSAFGRLPLSMNHLFASRRCPRTTRKPTVRPVLEALEDRTVPALFAPAPESPFGTGGTQPQLPAVADFNGDGIADLAIADRAQNSVTIFLGDGDGTFTSKGKLPATGDPSDTGPIGMAVGLFDGDDFTDLAVTFDCQDPDPEREDSKVVIFRGDGKGDFTLMPGGSFSSGGKVSTSIAVGDLDSDGEADLVVTNIIDELNNSNVAVFLGNGNGTFAPATESPIGVGTSGSYFAAVGDVDGNSVPDLAVVTNNKVTILLGDGDGTFTEAAKSPLDSGGNFAKSLAFGNFNDDENLDLVVVHFNNDTVSVFLGNGDGTFAAKAPFASGSNNMSSVTVTDFNDDGIADLAIAAPGPSVVRAIVLLGVGDGTFAPADGSPFQITGASETFIALGDFDGNGAPDLVVTNVTGSGGQASILLNTRGTKTTLTSTANPSSSGQAVVFTATVTSQNGSPAVGFVSFFDGDTLLGASALSGGLAVFGTAALPPGDHDITAVFSRNTFHNSSSAELVQQVDPPFGTVGVQPDPLMLGAQALVIHGTQGDDVITVTRNGSSTTSYRVTINGGATQLVFGINGRIVIFGHDGEDTITLAANVTARSQLDGGDGNDVLTGGAGKDFLTGGLGDDTFNGRAGVDRLVESGDVNMILAQGTTRRNGSLTTNGLGNDVLFRNTIEQAHLTGGPSANSLDASLFIGTVLLFGLGGDDVLTGGARNDILVGGDGGDTLSGLGGRDLLIGGLGADQLFGGVGDDLLIGGSTNHDDSVAALEAVMLEWASAASYPLRVAHLLGTKPGSKSGAVRLNSTTVFDDDLANMLSGGLNRDWFFRRTADSITDLNVGGIETVSTLP